MKKIRYLILFIAMSILFGISSEAAVSINKKSTTVFIGFAEQLSISGSSNKAVWSSSNKKIVEVMPNGVIYGIKPGKATVTAKVGKKKLKCRVTVRNYSRKMNISKSFVDPEVALDLRVDISDYPRSKKMNLINCSDGSALYYLVLELPKKNRSKITNIYLGHRLITYDGNGVEVSDHLYEYRYGKERFSAPLLAKSGIAVLPITDWYFYRRASVNTGRMYNTVFVIITYSGGKTEHYAYGTMINYVDKLPTKDF